MQNLYSEFIYRGSRTQRIKRSKTLKKNFLTGTKEECKIWFTKEKGKSYKRKYKKILQKIKSYGNESFHILIQSAADLASGVYCFMQHVSREKVKIMKEVKYRYNYIRLSSAKT